jgi:hypothetical protein
MVFRRIYCNHEEEAANSTGGELVFTADEQYSSTTLINEHLAHWTEEQKSIIKQIKQKISLDQILESIDNMKGKRVLIVGEAIIDRYVFCEAKGISSKSPNISALYDREEVYAGGSMAIARHLKSLGLEVTLLITSDKSPLALGLIQKLESEGIKLVVVETPGIPTPTKTRFLQVFRAQRMFEVMDLRRDQWEKINPDNFIKIMCLQ